jgi:hypothetical protein
MDPITAAADFRAALALDRCAIFLRVSWAIQARQSEASTQMVLDRMAEGSAPFFPFFKLAVSDQQGETWEDVRAWLKKND